MVDRYACETHVEVICGSARQRRQFAEMRAACRGDAGDHLGGVGFAVDAAEQFVSDCLREAICRLRPAREGVCRGSAGCDLEMRRVTCERAQRLLWRLRRRCLC